MENHRLDLNKKDSADLEDIKCALTDPLENDNANVFSLINYFNNRSSASAPNTPVESKGFNFPSLGRSIPDLSVILPINLNMAHVSEIEDLKASRSGLKAWITRSLNSVKEMRGNKTLTLSLLQKQETFINERINRILEIEEKINEIYVKHKVSESDSTRVSDADEMHKLILNSQNTVATCEELLIDRNKV